MIGKAITFFRNERKLTQQELAVIVGMSQKTISKIEKEERQLTDAELQRFADALTVPKGMLQSHNKSVQNISNSTIERGQINASTYIEGKEELHNELHSSDKLHIEFLQATIKKQTETIDKQSETIHKLLSSIKS